MRVKGSVGTQEFERLMSLFTDWYELDQKAKSIEVGLPGAPKEKPATRNPEAGD